MKSKLLLALLTSISALTAQNSSAAQVCCYAEVTFSQEHSTINSPDFCKGADEEKVARALTEKWCEKEVNGKWDTCEISCEKQD